MMFWRTGKAFFGLVPITESAATTALPSPPFTTQDGLVDNEVRTLLEDQGGTLWFGTNGGVSRYDGATFTAFTTQDGLVDNEVRTLLEDRAGNLWFGTDNGISRFAPEGTSEC